MARMIAMVMAVLAFPALASAQNPDWRFHWQKGQVLHYKVDHQTDVSETIGGAKLETKSHLKLTKRWNVDDVDSQGVATVRLSIVAMRNEQISPRGDVLLFDSAAPDKSTPELRDQLTKYIGQTLAIVRMDTLGRVLEVKQGPGNRYDVEPPLVLLMPPSPPAPNQAWERDYSIAVEPTASANKIPAKQRYSCLKIDGKMATISINTVLVNVPDNKLTLLPLIQKMPQGEVIFDLANGRMFAARLLIDRTIEGHQGEGSRYHFVSTYVEQYAD
jgi:hypothetical protein